MCDEHVHTHLCVHLSACVRLGTVAHLALPTPESHTPPSASPGQPPAWHSRQPGPELLSVCKTMAGAPEVRRPPGTRFPPPHSIPGLFLSLQSLSPRSRAHQGKEIGGGGLDWHLAHCGSLGVPTSVHPSAEQTPAPATLPGCPSQPSSSSLCWEDPTKLFLAT